MAIFQNPKVESESDFMSVLITGGTGFVGKHLQRRLLSQDKTVIVCTRDPHRAQFGLVSRSSKLLGWSPLSGPISIPADLVSNSPVSCVFNLMGESVAGRWTAERKKSIVDSRVLGTRNLVDGLIQSGQIPDVMVSASAVGFYGDRGEEVLDENSLPGEGFLAELAQRWEYEAERLVEHGTRVIRIRIGIVLGREGGALKEMRSLFRWGLGGKLGSGQQWFPWIHVNDLIGLMVWCAENNLVQGAVNGTAPNPVRNVEMTRSLAAALHRPAFFSAPKIALRLILGEFADTLLASHNVVPKYAMTNGFQFEFSSCEAAVKDLLR